MNSLTDHGTYRLTYTPPASDGSEYYPNISIEMSMSGDADVNQMLRFYEAFLAAAGYLLKGDLQVAEEEGVFDKQYWQSKYLELLGTPSETVYPYSVTCQGSQGTDFIPFFDSKELEG